MDAKGITDAKEMISFNDEFNQNDCIQEIIRQYIRPSNNPSQMCPFAVISMKFQEMHYLEQISFIQKEIKKKYDIEIFKISPLRNFDLFSHEFLNDQIFDTKKTIIFFK